MAIISGPLQGFDILDRYGVIGSEGTGTESEFNDGRAVRKRSCDKAVCILGPRPVGDRSW